MQQVRRALTATMRGGSFWWRLLLSCLMVLSAISVLPNLVQPAAAVSTTIVISQFQVAGGTAADEFVELHNVSNSSVDINGYSLAYRSAAGTTDVQLTTWTVSTIIPAGGYYLIGAMPGYDGTTAADAAYSDGGSGRFSGSSGGLALRNGVYNTGTIIDSVGYGTATNAFVEGTPATVPALNNSAVRQNNGCLDSDNNASDFQAATPAAPRNGATTPAICGAPSADTAPTVASTTPANGATGVAVDANITVTFSEAVNSPSAAFTISCTPSGPRTFVLSGGPTTFTLNPDTDFATGDSCTVNIDDIQVSDQDATDPPDTMAADYSVTFVVGTPPAGTTRIHDIQGAAHRSPLLGSAVTNVPGIVTATRSNGFYLQDPNPDSDAKTSEAIFVFTSSAPPATAAVGNSVVVSGTVSEFRPGSSGLSITQITGPTIAAGVPAAAPSPIVIGAGGRVPPTTVIEDDASNVEMGGTFDPDQDGIDFYESLEGMLVQVNNAVAVGPTSRFSADQPGENREIPVVPDNGSGFGPRTSRGGVVIQPNDYNPERITLNDNLTGVTLLPIVNVGDGLGTVTGVIDYSFDNFKLQVLALPTRTNNNLPREVTGVTTAPNSLTVATFNVENLDPSDGAVKFDALAAIVVNNLQAPDIIALEEIQDNNGAANDGVVDADQTFNALIAAIQRAGGPAYQFRQINPVDDQDGGEPGGNIRVGFLFRTDRGVSFVDRPNGTSTTAVGVVGTGTSTQLTFSPGRIDPTNSAFNNSRKPLAGEFRFNGRTFFVIANHFNSKGGDQPLFGVNQPPTLSSETQRRQQAQIVHDFVQQIVTADPNANVVVLGDLNDFQFSAPLAILKGANPQLLYTLIDTLPASEQYTYVYQGNSQALDHIMVSPNLFTNSAVAYDVVHVNAEFGDQISDHDPQVVRFTVPPTPPTAGTVNVATTQNTAVSIVLNGSAANGGSLQYNIVTQPAHGTLSAINGDRVTYTPTGNYIGSDSFTYTVTENGVTSNTATVNITVTAPTTPIYTLTVSTSGSGSVTPGSGSYTAGQVATLAAVPASGNTFIGWTVDGIFAGLANPLSITMGTDHSVVATFAPTPAFSDVSSGTPYSEAILRLAARGIINGYGVDECAARGLPAPCFGPADPVARAQIAALIVRALGWDAENPGGPAPFSDLGSVDPELQRAVAILAQRGIARGYGDGTYGPLDEVTRAQAISLIARSMVQAGYWQAVTVNDPSVYPNVPADSPHRLDLLTFVKYTGALPDRPADQAWADWETTAPRGWCAELLDRALRSRFATTP